MRRFLVLSLVLTFVLIACGASPTVTQAPLSTATNSTSPTQAPTSTSTITPTSSPLPPPDAFVLSHDFDALNFMAESKQHCVRMSVKIPQGTSLDDLHNLTGDCYDVGDSNPSMPLYLITADVLSQAGLWKPGDSLDLTKVKAEEPTVNLYIDSDRTVDASSKIALLGTPSPTGTPTPTATPQLSTLRDFADKIGFEIGAYYQGNTPDLLQIAREQFNLGQIYLGWPYTEPSRGNFDQTALRYYTSFAERNNMATSAGTLIWQADLPDWILHGDFSRDDLVGVMRDHIRGIMSPYKGKVKEWFVVNEPYNPPYRPNDIFYQAAGLDYIEIAFRTARETDPSAILIYSDAPNWTSNGISTRLTHQIVEMLKPKGLIDGVALQMHMLQFDNTPPDKSDVIATMRSYGIPVYISEFDVNLKDIAGTQEQRYAFQAKIYKDMLEACLESGVCKSFTVFGIKDNLSVWETLKQLQGYSPNADPLPWDDNLNPKPAYFAMLQVLKEYYAKQTSK